MSFTTNTEEPKCPLFYKNMCQQIGENCGDCVVAKLTQEVAWQAGKKQNGENRTDT